MGNLGSSFPGNLTIWREIKSFHMKKYIRYYSGKFVGNVTIFLEMLQSSWEVYIFSSPDCEFTFSPKVARGRFAYLPNDNPDTDSI